MQNSTAPSPLQAGLHIAATPIGHLSDITLRVLSALAAADIVLCEDTRVSKKLLTHYNINVKKLERYDDHSNENDRERILTYLKNNQSIVLICDAGSPLISDPGYKLVKSVRDNHFPISVLPGPCSAIAALQLSGIASDQFFFEGFLPRKKMAIIKRLNFFQRIFSTVIIYESSRRIVNVLRIMQDNMPDCEIAIVREITKIYEESITGTVAEILSKIEKKPLKGECIIVIRPQQKPPIIDSDIQFAKLVKDNHLLQEPAKKAARFLASHTGQSIKDMYTYIIKQKNTPS